MWDSLNSRLCWQIVLAKRTGHDLLWQHFRALGPDCCKATDSEFRTRTFDKDATSLAHAWSDGTEDRMLAMAASHIG